MDTEEEWNEDSYEERDRMREELADIYQEMDKPDNVHYTGPPIEFPSPKETTCGFTELKDRLLTGDLRKVTCKQCLSFLKEDVDYCVLSQEAILSKSKQKQFIINSILNSIN